MNLVDTLQEVGLKTNISLVIFTMALLACRILPVIVLSPFLGGEVVPTEVKIGLGVMLAAVMLPAVQDQMGAVPTNAIPFIALMLKELFIGLAISFVVSMVFEAAQMAGHVIDTTGGAAMAQVMVPQIGQQVTLFSSLKLQLAVVVFLTLNGHHMVITALTDSFILIPLDQMPAFSRGSYPFFEAILRVFGELMKLALAIAAPAMLAGFLTDLALGMINRVAPQVQVFFISMSIKPVVSVLIVMLSLHLVVDRLNVEFARMLQLLRETLHLMA